MEEDKNIPEAAKKFTMDTSSDMHFDMLADPTKLKMIPPNLVDKSDLSTKDNIIIEKAESVNSDSDSVSSVKVDADSESSKKSSERSNSSSESPKFYSNNITNDQNNSFNKSNNDVSFGNEKKQETVQPKKEFPTIYNSAGNAGFNNLDVNAQRMARMEKYAELISIKRSGITLTKEYNINSDYTEMCFEVDYWTNHQKKKDAVELGKSFGKFNIGIRVFK